MGLIVPELVIGNAPEEVTNPFSGVSCLLEPEAVAVYDYIHGCIALDDCYSDALRYFREKWPKEYMILLD